MADSRITTCRDCLYVEACFALNPELQTHRRDFFDTDLCAKQCKTFKARKNYISRKQVSTYLRNLRYVVDPFSSAQLDLLSMIELGLDRFEIPRFTDEHFERGDTCES